MEPRSTVKESEIHFGVPGLDLVLYLKSRWPQSGINIGFLVYFFQNAHVIRILPRYSCHMNAWPMARMSKLEPKEVRNPTQELQILTRAGDFLAADFGAPPDRGMSIARP